MFYARSSKTAVHNYSTMSVGYVIVCDRVTLSYESLCLASGRISPSSLYKLVVGFCQELILSRNNYAFVWMLFCWWSVYKWSLYSATPSLSHYAMMCSCELWPPATHRLLVHYLQHSLYHTYMYLFLVHSINIQTQSLHECGVYHYAEGGATEVL